jgi:hypothetical protein
MGINSRRVEDLHPAFGPIVAEVLRRAPEHGIYPFIIQGSRAPGYQACLFAQGRLAVGSSASYYGLATSAALSKDRGSVIVTCGTESNVVPLRKWGSKITEVGPYGSWHVLRLAVDFSFRSGPATRDDLVHDLEEAAATARSAKKPEEAAKLNALIAQKYATLNEVWTAVAPAAIWGNDWDDDGIMNGPDPDNDWTDLPHFEWHPGIRSIGAITPEQKKAILAGTLPAAASQCKTCKGFGAVAIDGECEACHARRNGAPAK